MSTYTKDPLFTAILANDTERIKQLKSQGAALSDDVKRTLSINRLNDLQNEDALWAITCDFQCAVRPMSAEDFIKTIRALRDEIGAPIFFMPAIWADIKKIMFEDGVWECVLDCFDNKMNKARTMRDIIKKDRADILEICAKHDWLSQPKKRDEMIEYANENGKTECLAFLLDFKSRTADLAAEYAKAEKKLESELNAAPDSVTALKQIWSYKKQDDGSLMITGYKGSRTEVTVPEKIGRNTVTAIGDSAFCPFAAKIKPEVKEFRKAITKITLPYTVRSIGRAAFWDCGSLVSVNIPDGVEKIRENTFAECRKLKKIVIPKSVKHIERRAFYYCSSLRFLEISESVEVIGDNAFALCDALITLVLPSSLKSIGNNVVSAGGSCGKWPGIVAPSGSLAEKYFANKGITAAQKPAEVTPGSSAEDYCIRKRIPYIYKEDKD